jgi:hypothetical protein
MAASNKADGHPERSGLELVIQKAIVDPDFRTRLISDPRAAIAIDFGIQLPADFRLKFIEKDPEVDVMVVLPDLVQRRDDDGSEVELRHVRGGTKPVWLAQVSRAVQKVPWG